MARDPEGHRFFGVQGINEELYQRVYSLRKMIFASLFIMFFVFVINVSQIDAKRIVAKDHSGSEARLYRVFWCGLEKRQGANF